MKEIINRFYYLDPPYYGVKNLYKYSLNDENDWNSFEKWNIYSEEWKYTSSNTKKSPVKIGKELIITNYEVNKNELYI